MSLFVSLLTLSNQPSLPSFYPPLPDGGAAVRFVIRTHDLHGRCQSAPFLLPPARRYSDRLQERHALLAYGDGHLIWLWAARFIPASGMLTMRADWSIPCHTVCDQRVSVYFSNGMVITQRYFRYRSCHYRSAFPSMCSCFFLLFLRLSPSCVSDRPNSSLKHDDWAPVNHFAFFAQVTFVVVILHTGNWPGPALAVSAHFSRFSPAQLCLVQADRKCANFLFLAMASDWRTMDARYPHPERNTDTQVENCFQDPCHDAQYYLSSSRKVPCHARTHHAPHRTSSAAQTSQDDR